MLAKNHVNFLVQVKLYEKLKQELDGIRDQLEKDMTEAGMGSYIQDPDTGTVYKIVKPSGTFMYYRDIEYVRTAQEGERAGSLSKKEAEGAGFILKK